MGRDKLPRTFTSSSFACSWKVVKPSCPTVTGVASPPMGAMASVVDDDDEIDAAIDL